MVEAAQRTAGLRTGFYSSPHLHRVNERIRVEGEEIADDDLARAISAVAEASNELSLTYFEFLTAVAFWHFRERGIQVAILETGLGGRLDATNVVVPVATALTSLGLDHQQILGTTLSEIAAEKAGILKPGVICAVATPEPDARQVIVERAGQIGAPLWIQGRDFSLDADGYHGRNWQLPHIEEGLSGPHQRQNAAVALALLEIASRSLPITADAARAGIATARWPGRMESFFTPSGVEVILDGAHNPPAARALALALHALQPAKPVRLVFGVLEDKELDPMLQALFPLVRAAYLARPDNPRGRAPETYLEDARERGPEVLDTASVTSARQAALAAAGPHERVLVCGSLYVVAEARELLAPTA